MLERLKICWYVLTRHTYAVFFCSKNMKHQENYKINETEVIELVETGKLSAGHARSLVVVTNPDVQLKLANQVMGSKLTVRDMENAVKAVSKENRKTITKQVPTMSLEMREFKNNLERKFSTKIEIKGTEKKGKIIINYYNSDDLDRIYDILN